MRIQTVVTLLPCIALLGGCATPPARDTQVVVMSAEAMPAAPGLPPPGTTWRLDERDLLALSPAPHVPPPPVAIVPPPRAAPVLPYAPPYPYYGDPWPYYGPGFGLFFGYSHSPSHSHRRGWRRR